MADTARNGQHESPSSEPNKQATIQVICLGSGGGPSEDNVTGFLVRSTRANWAKGSVLAVDAGTHLSAIQRILERHEFPPVIVDNHTRAPTRSTGGSSRFQDVEESSDDEDDDASSQTEANRRSNTTASSPGKNVVTAPRILDSGPFAGLKFPHATSRANAVHVVREHVSTYLITHPHLDHFSGFAINTAAFHNTSRPKRLAALPFCVNAIKNHIFNDIIWPNLTDEEGGVGLVTFQRLTEGGNLALGEGASRGFIEICDGLAVKGFKVSHGRCAGAPRLPDYQQRRASNANAVESIPQNQHVHASHLHNPPNGGPKSNAGEVRRASVYSQSSQPGTPNMYPQPDYASCVVDSSAYFIRSDESGKEILMFGDVEPDSLSAMPRNHIIWAEAAPKVATGMLAGIFIECSYNDTQADAVLFGHLNPRHLVQELETLAESVSDYRKESAERIGKKRKRHNSALPSSGGLGADSNAPSTPIAPDEIPAKAPKNRTLANSTPKRVTLADEPMRDFDEGSSFTSHTDANAEAKKKQFPRSAIPKPLLELSDGKTTGNIPTPPFEGPLKGLQVVIMHVKDTMMDGPLVGESILEDLWAHEADLAQQGRGLGCKFEVATSGDSFWF